MDLLNRKLYFIQGVMLSIRYPILPYTQIEFKPKYNYFHLLSLTIYTEYLIELIKRLL